MNRVEQTPSGSIGVVVIGRNEGARLSLCLGSIRPYTQRIVYADSGSTDGSREVASHAGAHVLRLDDNLPHTAARGRREGLAELLRLHPDCEFVQFIDGDCVMADEWLTAASTFMQSNPQVAVVCGRRRELHPDASAYNHLCDDEWNTPVGEAEACGGDSMMRVSAVLEVGGFSPELRAGEEPELCSRLRAAKWKVWRIDAAMTEHDAAILHFGQWWKRALRGGFGYAQVHQVTSQTNHSLYGRQLRSALIWVVGVPLVGLFLALAARSPLPLLLPPLLWGAQIARIAVRTGAGSFWSWHSAALLMTAKVPELLGAARFVLQRERSAPLEYKAGS